MESDRFDRLVRTLTAANTRRGLFRLFPALPLAGWLAAWLGAEEAVAAGRRHRRKKGHKHGRPRPHGKRKKNTRTRCSSHSQAKTCAGRCGQVQNTCRKTVDCGSCGAATPVCHEETCVSCMAHCGASCAHCVTMLDGEVTCAGIVSMVCAPVCRRDEDCPEDRFCAASVFQVEDNAPFICGPAPGSGEGKCIRIDSGCL